MNATRRLPGGQFEPKLVSILRHGYTSYHPDEPGLDNRVLLMNELADFNSVQLLMEGSGDVFRTGDEIERVLARKLTYTHHQEKS